MIVSDANITAYLLIESGYSQLARDLYALDSEWIVPSIWPHEFANLLSTYAKQGGLSVKASHDTWADGVNLFDGRVMETDFNEVLKLAIRHRLTVYDAEYVHLAQSRGVSLVTEDKKILNAFPKQAFSLQAYLNNA